jgi:hypothetical protein
MATIDHCRLLCASASAYLIETNYPSGIYQLDLAKPKLPPEIPLPIIPENTIRQYNSIGLISQPYVIVASQTSTNPNLKIEACFVGETKEGIIISFRGTLPPFPVTQDSIADWIENIFYADTVTNPNLPGKVHQGFLEALLSLQSNIHKAIHKLDPTHSKPLYMTGHSKGGALAPIAAAYFKGKGLFTANHVVTFAGAKPGDGTFASNYNVAFPNSTNYENYLDVVPFLAPGKSFIKLIEKVPLPEFLKNLLEKAAKWDYEPVGAKNVQYVNSLGKVDNSFPDADPYVRFAEILWEFTKGKKGLEQVADAHHVSCGFRYMAGTCKGSVCQL